MTPHHPGALASALIAMPCGVLAALAVALLPSPAGWLAGAGVTCYLVFLVLPWLCLPAGVLGGGIAASPAAGHDLPTVVLIHSGILLAGALALATRRLVAPSQFRRRRTAVDVPMLILIAAIVLGAGYGLARDNEPYLVMVAAYQVAVIPAYFFLATAGLSARRAVEAAGATFVAALLVVILAGHYKDVGLFSALALTPLMACAGAVSGRRRAGLSAVCAVLAANIMLTEYRTLWVAGGAAVLILLIRGSARVRTTAGVAVAAGGLALLGGAALDPGIGDRWNIVKAGLSDSPGYRQAEAVVGLRAWSEHPLIGAGLGQSSRSVYLEGLGRTDVGPTYHAFWVIVLANLGLVGLLAVLAPLLLAVSAGLRTTSGPALGLAATLCGFLLSATFAAPTDGHWELGLLAALTMLTAHWNDRQSGRKSHPYEGTEHVCSPDLPSREHLLRRGPAYA
ncbi:O-antigen ligase family protein [Flindersiella endophytica]